MASFNISDIVPSIGTDGHPYVNLKANEFSGELLVDTGFSDGLSLPLKFEKKFKDNLSTPTRFTLADGRVAKIKVYLVNLVWAKKTLGYCSVIFMEQDQGLAGIEFFRLLGKDFLINWQQGRFVLQ